MVHKLFKQLERELKQVEKFSTDDKVSARSAKNARTLETLQRTMAQLTRMEAERVKQRRAISRLTKEEALAAMQRKLDLLLERHAGAFRQRHAEREPVELRRRRDSRHPAGGGAAVTAAAEKTGTNAAGQVRAET